MKNSQNTQDITNKWYEEIINLSEALELPTAKLYTQIGKDARENELTRKMLVNVIDPVWEKFKRAGEFASKRGDRVYYKFEPSEKLSYDSGLAPIFEKAAKLTTYIALGLEAQNPNSTVLDNVRKVSGVEPLAHTPENIFIRLLRPVISKVHKTIQDGELEAVPMPVGDGVIDFVNGTVQVKNRIVKIGKLAEMLINKGAIPAEYVSDLRGNLNAYNTIKSQQGAKTSGDFYIVISRHPVDVAGMSTDRGWSSCMKLPTQKDPVGGINRRYVKCDVETGTFVAYLIRQHDINIQKPVARILIKPFYSTDEQHVYYQAEKRMYGTASRQFAEELQKILNEVQPERELPKKLFKMPDTLYRDTLNIGAHSSFYIKDNRPAPRIIKYLDKAKSLFNKGVKAFDNTIEKVAARFIHSPDLPEYVNLEHIKVAGADIRGLDLRNTGLEYVDFTQTKAQNVLFNGSNLRIAKFIGAKLQSANFTDAKCNAAKFNNADLTGANFQNADVTQADFSGANLTGVNFNDAENLHTVKYDKNTTLPKGFKTRVIRSKVKHFMGEVL